MCDSRLLQALHLFIAEGAPLFFMSTREENFLSAHGTYYRQVCSIPGNSAGRGTEGGEDFGRVRYATVSNDSEVAFAPEYLFNAGNTLDVSCAALADSSYVICFRDLGDSEHGTGLIGQINL